MAALIIPPINPNAKTIIDLDYGQQIIIDKDTHFGRVKDRLNDANPATGIKVEPSGICWSFTIEDGVWWHNEYVGDAHRNPQLQKKIRATEEERVEREKARREWEERNRSSMPSNPAVTSNSSPQPASYYNHTPMMPEPPNAQRFPQPEPAHFVHVQQNTQANSFPPPPSFPVNATSHTPHFRPPPVFPHQARVPPQPPSFPPGFPFNSDHPAYGPPHRGFPIPPSPPPGQPNHAPWSSHPHPEHGGYYAPVDGNTANLYVDQSANIIGNNNNVNYSPEWHNNHNYNWP